MDNIDKIEYNKPFIKDLGIWNSPGFVATSPFSTGLRVGTPESGTEFYTC